MFIFISFMFIGGLFLFVMFRNHILILLFSLEYLVIITFLMFFFLLITYNYELYFILFYLVFSVCEGALGLGVLVNMIRSHGNDLLMSFSILSW